MAAPLDVLDYDHVVSKREVSEVRRLLRSVDQPDSTSLVMSERLKSRRGLLALRGVGKEIWEGEDAQVYVDRLRDEWNR